MENKYDSFIPTGSKGKALVSWLEEFVQLCPTLEVLVPPMECITDRTIGRIYSPLTQLKELYLTEAAYAFSFRQIAGHFPQLRKISLSHFQGISLGAFLQFVDLAPNLDTVHLHRIRFGGPGNYDDDESTPLRNPEHVGEDLVELSGRSRFLIHQAVVSLTVAPTGWFSKLRGLDIVRRRYRSIEFILDLVAKFPMLDAIHVAPKLLQPFFQREEIYPRLSPNASQYLHIFRRFPSPLRPFLRTRHVLDGVV